MPAPKSPDELVDLIRRSALLDPARLDGYLASQSEPLESPSALATRMQADGLLTPFHVEQLMKGKHRGFFLGKYKLIDRIGFGGMGQVFLCEHVSMRRRAALKVLPPDRTDNPYSRERFLREARAAGQLDHPNVVRAFDVDQEGDVYFLVMEYVDGVSFHDLVNRFGPLTPQRAGYYLYQAARGLAYLHACELVHRDIKPANLLVDRQGVVKILDLGLVRGEQHANDDLTRKEGVKILGTADYLAPEQAINCSSVDFRADVYGLGATGYFLLTGHPPFPAEKVAQKLMAHQVKVAKPIHQIRDDVPPEFSAVISKMLSKKPADRYQRPEDLLEALAPWATKPPPPPAEHEIPNYGGAYGSAGTVSFGGSNTARGSSLGSGSGSGVKHVMETPASSRPTLLTPVPRQLPRFTPKPDPIPALLNTPLPPALPAAATHSYDHVPVAAAPDAAPESAILVPAPLPPPERSRRRVVMVLALVLTVAVGVWDAVVLTRASARPRVQPTQQSPPDPVANR
jgi:serine/threonine protein kinase